jgi:hypothetical protein
MIVKNNRLLLYGALLWCLPSYILADLTTLQSWDPIPFYNAANLNMPPDTLFCYGVKRRILHEDTQKHRRWGINVSPFVQRAIKAQQTDDIYFGVAPGATLTPGQQMSDYQGTPFLMGLFLGKDVNGNSIWGGPDSVDTGVITDITYANVMSDDYELPIFLKDAVVALNNCPTSPATTPPTPPDYDNAILYNTPTNTANTSPSILSQSVLDQDPVYFGAFSVPLTYQKSGFRWELNFDFSENIGFLARGGFVQITQRAGPAISLSALAPATSKIDSSVPSIYTGLNTYYNARSSGTGSSNGIPVALAQGTFNEWVSNNIDDLLDPEDGVDYNIQTFSQPGIEDIQLLGFYRHPLMINPANPNKYASVMVTPYVMVGGTIPLAAVKDYSKLYALPFGNNSHGSVGGVAGVTFDFIDSIEFGFEFGATGFFTKTIEGLPVPNHELQRVLYPYRQDVRYSPGFNGQFGFIFNAYEFAHNTSFSFKYNYVQHMQDTIKLITPSEYFFPYYLEETTPWTSQMFIASLVFEVQPSVYLSIAWQGALSQKNAYCSNTILGSLNFLF